MTAFINRGTLHAYEGNRADLARSPFLRTVSLKLARQRGPQGLFKRKPYSGSPVRMEHGLPRVGFSHGGGFGFQVVVSKKLPAASSLSAAKAEKQKLELPTCGSRRVALVEWHGSLDIDPLRTNRLEYHWAGRAAARVRHISRG